MCVGDAVRPCVASKTWQINRRYRGRQDAAAYQRPSSARGTNSDLLKNHQQRCQYSLPAFSLSCLTGQYQVACTDFQYGASQQWTGPSLCLMFVLTRMLSSRTAVLCALYGVGGDLSFLHCCFACCVAHTQPHSVCPVPSVELPCLCTYNIRFVTSDSKHTRST
eukprot:jgi/Chrzof1/279/Cz01g09220.t1